MKILHLSDLHIGKTLNSFSMIEDQKYILDQIIAQIISNQIDCLLICGDIFDHSTPSGEAISLWDDFLVKLNQIDVTTLIIAGNHDGKERLQYASHFLSQSKIYIETKLKEALVKVQIKGINFYLLPYCRLSHLNYMMQTNFQSLNEAVQAYLDCQDIDDHQTNILLAHQFVGGSEVMTSDSEILQVGGSDQISHTVFKSFDYVALGHLHTPQMVSATQRYCGSILKYSFSEAKHQKSLTVLEVDQEIKLSYVPLIPLRDMVIMTCYFDALKEISLQYLGSKEDYIHLILKDKKSILNVMEKARAYFPNIMFITFEYQNKNNIDLSKPLLNQQEITLFEHFEQFYQKQNQLSLTQFQTEWLKEIMEDEAMK